MLIWSWSHIWVYVGMCAGQKSIHTSVIIRGQCRRTCARSFTMALRKRTLSTVRPRRSWSSTFAAIGKCSLSSWNIILSLHCEGREDEHCKDERSDNWIAWYLLRRKAALVQSEMAGAEQADQEVVTWRVGSHGWLVPKSHPWWSLNPPGIVLRLKCKHA